MKRDNRYYERGQADLEMLGGVIIVIVVLGGLGLLLGWFLWGEDANTPGRPYVDLQLTTTITVPDESGQLHTVTFTEILVGIEQFQVTYDRPAHFVVTANGGTGKLALYADGRHRMDIVPETMQTETTYQAKSLIICVPAILPEDVANQVDVRSLLPSTCPTPAEAE